MAWWCDGHTAAFSAFTCSVYESETRLSVHSDYRIHYITPLKDGGHVEAYWPGECVRVCVFWWGAPLGHQSVFNIPLHLCHKYGTHRCMLFPLDTHTHTHTHTHHIPKGRERGLYIPVLTSLGPTYSWHSASLNHTSFSALFPTQKGW